MKKLFAVIIIATTLLGLLGGCGGKAPIEKAQAKAVEIGRQYLDYEITGKEAREQLQAIKVPETEGNGQVYLEADIAYLAFIIAKSDSTYAEIEKRVDSIEAQDYTR